MAGDARGTGDELDQFIAPIHGFDGTDAELFEASFFEVCADELFEPCWFCEVSSPSSEVDSGDHHLTLSGGDQGVHLGQNLAQLQRPALSAHGRNHAERAAIVAAVLDF